MEGADEVVRRAQVVYGSRLRGLFAFGSRISGQPRPDSDLDLAVWLEGPIRRSDSWIPWIREFAASEPVIDPTFLTNASLDTPPSWLLEAVRDGVAIWFDPAGLLGAHLAEIRSGIEGGIYCRKLFMGLPYYARVAP